MSDRVRILIVEDEPAIARGLVFNFEQEGYEALQVADGPSALNFFAADADTVDVVVLDLMLPGMSGYEICEEIRDRDSDVPILVLSARTLSEDKARAFDVGADQYITKPFALPELLSRVRNLLSRRRPHIKPDSGSEVVTIGDATFNAATFEITRGDDTHELTTMEAALLRYFVNHPRAVLSRAEITKNVWGQSADVSTRSIDNFVMRLRRYLEDDPSSPKHFLSVRGTGYRFEP